MGDISKLKLFLLDDAIIAVFRNKNLVKQKIEEVKIRIVD